MKTYNIITIFPEMFENTLKQGVIAKACESGLIAINPINLRDFTHSKHKVTDDYQYGGGAGLVMKPEPIYEAVKSIGDTLVILLDPRGKKFNQKDAERLAKYDSLTFICGRYEGVDERVRELVVDEELSIGDFILTGGELAAMVVIDSVARLQDGVLGDETSIDEESFTIGGLEHPHYTRPVEFMGLEVPKVLQNGNHGEINTWRKAKSVEITMKYRPDLLDLDKQDVAIRKKLAKGKMLGESKRLKLNIALMHYPMKDKQGDTVATAVTNLDLHDISRSSRTYSVERFFVITPLEAQREISKRVINHWLEGYGATYNPNRSEAFSKTIVTDCLTSAITDIEKRHKKRPLLIATTARSDRATLAVSELSVIAETEPVLLLLGTGWGFTDEIFQIADYILEPIVGAGEFNHLSVRSATAIMLDRITKRYGGIINEEQDY